MRFWQFSRGPVVLGLLALATLALPAWAEDPAAPSGTRIKGTITGTDPVRGELTLKGVDDKDYLLQLDDKSQIRWENKDARLADLQKGSDVTVTYTVREGKRYLVSLENAAAVDKPAAKDTSEPGGSPPVVAVGTVSKVADDLKTLTLKTPKDTEIDLVIPERIKYDFRNGKGTVRDLSAGTLLKVTYIVENGKNVAVSITDKPDDSQGGTPGGSIADVSTSNGGQGRKSTLAGRVLRVKNNMAIIQTNEGDLVVLQAPNSREPIQIDGSTQVQVFNRTGTLGDLRDGEEVIVSYTTGTNGRSHADSIRVVPNGANGAAPLNGNGTGTYPNNGVGPNGVGGVGNGGFPLGGGAYGGPWDGTGANPNYGNGLFGTGYGNFFPGFASGNGTFPGILSGAGQGQVLQGTLVGYNGNVIQFQPANGQVMNLQNFQQGQSISVAYGTGNNTVVLAAASNLGNGMNGTGTNGTNGIGPNGTTGTTGLPGNTGTLPNNVTPQNNAGNRPGVLPNQGGVLPNQGGVLPQNRQGGQNPAGNQVNPNLQQNVPGAQTPSVIPPNTGAQGTPSPITSQGNAVGTNQTQAGQFQTVVGTVVTANQQLVLRVQNVAQPGTFTQGQLVQGQNGNLANQQLTLNNIQAGSQVTVVLTGTNSTQIAAITSINANQQGLSNFVGQGQALLMGTIVRHNGDTMVLRTDDGQTINLRNFPIGTNVTALLDPQARRAAMLALAGFTGINGNSITGMTGTGTNGVGATGIGGTGINGATGVNGTTPQPGKQAGPAGVGTTGVGQVGAGQVGAGQVGTGPMMGNQQGFGNFQTVTGTVARWQSGTLTLQTNGNAGGFNVGNNGANQQGATKAGGPAGAVTIVTFTQNSRVAVVVSTTGTSTPGTANGTTQVQPGTNLPGTGTAGQPLQVIMMSSMNIPLPIFNQGNGFNQGNTGFGVGTNGTGVNGSGINGVNPNQVQPGGPVQPGQVNPNQVQPGNVKPGTVPNRGGQR